MEGMRRRGGGMCGTRVCIVGGMHGRGACVTGETATAAVVMHPTRKHSCYILELRVCVGRGGEGCRRGRVVGVPLWSIIIFYLCNFNNRCIGRTKMHSQQTTISQFKAYLEFLQKSSESPRSAPEISDILDPSLYSLYKSIFSTIFESILTKENSVNYCYVELGQIQRPLDSSSRELKEISIEL